MVDAPAPAALLGTGAAVLRSGAARLNTGATLLMTGAAMLSAGAATLSAGAATLSAGAATLSAGAATLSTGVAMLSTGVTLLSSGTMMLSSGAMLLRGTGMVVMGGRRLRAGTAVGATSAGPLSAGVVSIGVPVEASRGANSEVARVTTGDRLLTSSGVATGREGTSGVDSPPVVTGSCTGKGFSVGAPEGRETAGVSGVASGDTAAEQAAPSPLPVEMTVTAWLKEGSSPHRSGLFETSLHTRQTFAGSRCAALVPDGQQAPQVAPRSGLLQGHLHWAGRCCVHDMT